MIARRADLISAVRRAFGGPSDARLGRIDQDTWLDIWRWESAERMRVALAGAPALPEAGPAFAVTRDLVAEAAELLDER